MFPAAILAAGWLADSSAADEFSPSASSTEPWPRQSNLHSVARQAIFSRVTIEDKNESEAYSQYACGAKVFFPFRESLFNDLRIHYSQ